MRPNFSKTSENLITGIIEENKTREKTAHLKQKRLEKERVELFDLAVILFADIKTSRTEQKNAETKPLVETIGLSKKEEANKAMLDVVLLAIKGFGETRDTCRIEKIPKETILIIFSFLKLEEQLKFASLSKGCSSLVVGAIKIDLYFLKSYKKEVVFSKFLKTRSAGNALGNRVVRLLLGGALGAYMRYHSPLGFFIMGLGCVTVLSKSENIRQVIRWISLEKEYCDWKDRRMNELMRIPQKYRKDPILSKNRCSLTGKVVRFPVRDKQSKLYELTEVRNQHEFVFDQDLCIKIHERLNEIEKQNEVIN
jgi:hypothetical protein